MTQNVLLGDIVRVRRGASPRPIQNYIQGTPGIPWVKIADATSANSRFISRTKEYIKEEGRKNSVSVAPGTLIMSNSATPGLPMIMKIDASVHDGWLILDELKDVDRNWLYYYLLDRRVQSAREASGSVFSNLKTDIVRSFKIELPDMETQRKVAEILWTIDEKIELNRQMNETLEQIGQALFRHYFITSPEAEGRGEVKIGELVNIKGGGTPSTKNPDFWDGNIAWTSPRDLTGKKDVFLLNTDKTVTEQGLSKISSGLLPKGTLLLSSRAPIGYVAIAGLPLAINQGYIAFLPDGYLPNHFMYFWLKHNMERIKNAANGSTFMEISKSAFRNIVTTKPDEKTLQDFETEVASIFDAIRNNQEQIQTLTLLRDTLLPRLINGKVKV